MTNLDRARRAFADWEHEYETTRKPGECAKGGELLAALHVCGCSVGARSLWRDAQDRTVELVCFADDGLDFIAVYKVGAENCFMPRASFMRRFKPLAGGEGP